MPCTLLTTPTCLRSHAALPLAPCGAWILHSSCVGGSVACSRGDAVKAWVTVGLFFLGNFWQIKYQNCCRIVQCDSNDGRRTSSGCRLERGNVYDEKTKRFAYELRLPKLPVPIQGAVEKKSTGQSVMHWPRCYKALLWQWQCVLNWDQHGSGLECTAGQLRAGHQRLLFASAAQVSELWEVSLSHSGRPKVEVSTPYYGDHGDHMRKNFGNGHAWSTWHC